MKSLKERYQNLQIKREPFLKRARDCAALTIPTLLPPEGHNATSKLPQPYQGLGARCVVTLASRMLVAFIPTGQPFFGLEVPPELLLQEGLMEAPPDLEKGFALATNLITKEIEKKAWRKPTSLTLELLVSTGNALERYMPDNSIRVYRLDQYVVVRDLSGNLVELILREKVNKASLPEQTQSYLKASQEDDVEIFTCAKRHPDGWEIKQEVEGQIIEGMGGVTPTNPFNPLRWSAVPGEDYGRGKVEEHFSDLTYLDLLSKSMVDGSAMATRHITMVRPNAAGSNLRKRFAEAKNGDVISGNPEDVDLKQFANVTGMQIAQQEIARITQELAQAFLLSSSMIRNAERVTAQEVRMIAEELESVLGGVYSYLSQDMMSARIEALMTSMMAAGQLPPVLQMTQPVLTVGLEALERDKDVMRVQTVLQTLQALPPDFLDYLDIPDLLKTFMIGLGLPGKVKTEQEAQQTRQQRLMAEQQAQAQGQAGGPPMPQ
ncbi:portal protein [Roseibium alexandrii]|uniref:Bacteriophage head to tail connecting protein n=1 Tax=Roseibium alexandrii (strain DSM 17067 / NCIMB 14079 / DFL-11) TaxID=244592 RepID=A0A5E8GUH2_ROSAD|nr:portal protein [Roseibium alexandrii]EEE42851.1 Bacteriophage head to tail connecting protein [Roseibium alexandrii DFL-11]